jgi:hypothetical protein
MSQPVKLSDELVLDARLTADLAERSIAGQIEFWAKLGRAIEPLLQGMQALRLTRQGNAVPLSSLVSTVNSAAGQTRLAKHLKSLPYPHYEPSGKRGFLIRTDATGKRSLGRFVNKQFKVSQSLVK